MVYAVGFLQAVDQKLEVKVNGAEKLSIFLVDKLYQQLLMKKVYEITSGFVGRIIVYLEVMTSFFAGNWAFVFELNTLKVHSLIQHNLFTGTIKDDDNLKDYRKL